MLHLVLNVGGQTPPSNRNQTLLRTVLPWNGQPRVFVRPHELSFQDSWGGGCIAVPTRRWGQQGTGSR